MKRYTTIGLAAWVCLLILACGNSSSPAPTAEPQENRLFFAVYMVGSDLETDNDFATSDLMDMIAGYQDLNPADREGLEVLVAFGGSLKPTWNGVRYADMTCLIQDAADGIFGNDACYSYEAVIAWSNPEDMSDEGTLMHFMDTVKAASADYETVFFNFWNHGGSFTGFGNDENFNLTSLSVAGIANAFEYTGLRPTIIGFDACLMASAEVYAKLYPHADYLVASAELEPGHGWDYHLLLSGYTSDARTLAERVVDTFIESPAHVPTSGKTLSVVETASYPAFHASLDTLSVLLLDAVENHDDIYFPKLIKAIYGAQKYARNFSMDLMHFLERFRSIVPDPCPFQPDLPMRIDAVIENLDRTVVYNRHDGSRPNANGLSIFAMNNRLWSSDTYNEANTVTGNWYAFVRTLIEHDDTDVLPPVLAMADLSECGKDPSAGGTCYRITDDFAVQGAYRFLARETGQDHAYRMLTTTPLERTSIHYFYLEPTTPKVLELCAGAITCTTVDAESDIDQNVFQFLAVVNNLYADVTVRFADGQYLDHWVSGAYNPDHGAHPKDDGTIDPGDTVIPFWQIVCYDEYEEEWLYIDNSYDTAIQFQTESPPLFALVNGDMAEHEYIIIQDAQENFIVYRTDGTDLTPSPAP